MGRHRQGPTQAAGVARSSKIRSGWRRLRRGWRRSVLRVDHDPLRSCRCWGRRADVRRLLGVPQLRPGRRLCGSAQNHDGQGRCGLYDLERWPKRPRGSCTSSGLVGSSIRCDQASRVQLHEQVTSHPASHPRSPFFTEALVRRHARHSGRAGTPTLARGSSCPRRGPSCSAVSLHPPWLLSRPDTPAPNRTPRRGTTGPAAHRQGSCTGGSPCCSPPEGRADTKARMLEQRA